MQKTFPPEFSALMAQYRDTAAGLGDDHPLARRLWLMLVHTAPAWFIAEMSAMAQAMGLMPEPCACDDDGQRFYSLDALAAKLGVSADEVAQQMAALQAKDVRELHRLH